jgi:altronate dehydratase small subunit
MWWVPRFRLRGTRPLFGFLPRHRPPGAPHDYSRDMRRRQAAVPIWAIPPRPYHHHTVARKLLHVLHAEDNVATALVELAPGTVVERPSADGSTAGAPIEIRAAIPFGHKVALAPIRTGEPVRKYGEVIGLASADIVPGDHVHVHNVESQRGRGDLAKAP